MDLDVSFGNHSIHNDQTVDSVIAKQPFNISIRANPNELTTLIIYDLSAPEARNPVNSPFVHFLEINIPGNNIDKGDVLFEYMPPSPPSKSGDHVYVVDLFRQKDRIVFRIPDQRTSFPIRDFVQRYELSHYGRLVFRVVSDSGNISSGYDGQSSPSNKEGWTRNLGEEDAKYCRCIIESASRQPQSCVEEKAWGQYRDEHKCGNPFAICHASIQGESGRPECGENYVFENISDQELLGYAALNGINIPQSGNRQSIIQAIYQWEAQKKGHFY